LEVLFTARSGQELFRTLNIAGTYPDILLLDLRMQEMDGIQVIEELRSTYPGIHIVVISSYYQASFTGFMLKAGVAAFLPKEIAPAELPGIIRAVMRDGFYFLPGQPQALREQISARAPAPVLQSDDAISERELEILRLLCLQKTAKEIGEKLFITQRTVEGHKNNLFAKTGAKNIAGLVIYSIQRGIIRVEELPAIL
ncbi:MAG: response regulator transcription factor, partial [Flavobacteriales bacterium]